METTPLSEVLAGHRFFHSLDPAYREVIAGCAGQERFQPGSFLFREGEPADRFYAVRSGRVALEMAAPGVGAMIIDTAEAGEVVGVSWLFVPYRWQFDARAVEPVGAIGFDAVCLREKADADPRLGYALMKLFAEVLIRRMQSARVRLLDLYGDGRSGTPADRVRG
ncbi:cyclic nucleotide-binding domain-containing protein [Phytoactinopolyspora halotolerans]|uniref:Cyclic nucleotide-binding domain-containing protein n=1 Tax=Phytoactinopolyspora halotolerans TaxID=1981512 RepID=A0A6L9S6F8_9ACTN|nr:cyclic nucleotide-binding domain-containing protein [Phytoactinopolyspora halotolerans]NEE00597.1 cyclic nucleotide-binding domain-containing protein [Phytoactinopolyspora halotolerans]